MRKTTVIATKFYSKYGVMAVVDNLTDGWLSLNKTFTHVESPELMKWNTAKREYYLSVRNVLLCSKTSLAPDFYLEDLGYSANGGKIKNLMGKYLDVQAMRTWLEEIARWQNRDTPYFLPAKDTGKLPGSCLIGFSFRLTPAPHLLMLSRAVEMPHKGGADLLLMSGIARIIEERMALSEPLGCTWMMDTAWVTSRTARLFLIYQYPREVRYKNEIFHKGMIEGWQKFFIDGQPLSFSTGRKMQQFFEQKKSGTLTRGMGAEQFYNKLKEVL